MIRDMYPILDANYGVTPEYADSTGSVNNLAIFDPLVTRLFYRISD
jgi:hypothetical protein